MDAGTRLNVYRGVGFAVGVILLLLALWGVWEQTRGDEAAEPPDQLTATTTVPPTTAPAETAGAGADIPDAEGVDQIRAVQQRLNQLGYDAGPVDGAAGPKLAAALTSFQVTNGLVASGELNTETLDKLRSADALQASESQSSSE